jgi:hypothetical protein
MRTIAIREDPVGPADEHYEAMPAGVVPGTRISGGGREPDLTRLVSFADPLEESNPIEDHPVEPRQLVGRAQHRVARGLRGWR